MKKSFNNREFIEGRLYQHNLELKTVQNKESKNFGTEFITGTVDVATDEEGLNVISTHFTYVTEMTGNGNKNVTFGVLQSIINGAKTWITDGKDAALKVRINTALALNDFYTQDGQLVSAKKNEGGFVNTVRDLVPEEERNVFDLDMIITSITHPETEDGEDYIVLKGAVFNFRADLLPVELVCRDKGGISYFDSLEPSAKEPVFTRVKGRIVSNTIKQEIEEESAFGAASVRTVSRTVKEWQVNWAQPTEYVFGEEDTITAEELTAAIQAREVYLADVKKRHDEYQASRNANGSAVDTSPSAEVPSGDFNF